jgi:hypothetical protein
MRASPPGRTAALKTLPADGEVRLRLVPQAISHNGAVRGRTGSQDGLSGGRETKRSCKLYGPEAVHEAQAIVDALRKMLANEQQDQVKTQQGRVAQRIEH